MTKINKEPEKTLGFDPEKVKTLVSEIIGNFQQERPTTGEIIVTVSNVLYNLGASIEGYGDKGPGFEEVKQLYYENPGKPGIAMMMQSFTMSTWYEDWEKQAIKNNG